MRRRILWSAGVFLVSGAYAGCSDSSDAPAAAGSTGTGAASGVGAAGGASGASGASTGGAGAIGVGGSSGAIGGSGASSGSTGTTGGASGASGTLGVGGTGPSDAALPDVIFNYDARPQDTGVGDGCASVTARAEASPLDMYIILDNSGSMHEPQPQPPLGNGDCTIGQSVDSKWCRAINALNGFFNAGSSVGMGVALQYFNIGGDNCAPKSTPAVAMQNLPAHVSALATSLNNANPNGSTPTLSAADGIVAFTGPNQRAGRRMIGIIITDGDPQGCSNNNPTSVNTSIRTHYQNSGIPTFIVGMDGAAFNNLQTMGDSASPRSHSNYCGTGPNPCWYYSVGNGDPAAFVDALREIQLSAIGCVYNMPRTDAGVVDPARVRVTYSVGGTGTPQAVPGPRASSADCGGGGWYFDNPTRPTTINLCANTCGAVKSDTAARVDVIVGCQGS